MPSPFLLVIVGDPESVTGYWNAGRNLSLEVIEFATFLIGSGGAPDALVSLVRELFGLEALRGVKLSFEYLTRRGPPASVDPLVLRALPRVSAELHLVAMLFHATEGVPVSIDIGPAVELERIAHRIGHVFTDSSNSSVRLGAQFVKYLLLEPFLALEAEL